MILPQFSVTGNRTVTIRGRAADSRVTMVTPRPATALDTDAWLLRTGRSGPPIVLELYFPGTPVWLSPASTRPTVGTLRVAVNQHLESPPGRAVPYEYTLSYTDPPGIIPAQRYLVRAADLATVHERFYQAAPAAGGFAFNGSFPATNPNLDQAWFGFIEPAGPSLKLPGRLTEYAGGTGTARMEWFGQYEPGSAPWQSGDLRLLRPGERLTENWSAYPLHPTANVLLETEPNMFKTTQPSAVRAGNTLSLEVDPFGDNQAGHEIGGLLGSGVTGTYRIEQDGTKIAGGNAVTQASPYGEFYTTATLAPKPATIRFSLDLTRTSKLFPLSTATRTVWTWASAPVEDGDPAARLVMRAADPGPGLCHRADDDAEVRRGRAWGWTARHRPGARCCTCWPGTCRRCAPPPSPGRRCRCPSTAARPGTRPGSAVTAAATPRCSPLRGAPWSRCGPAPPTRPEVPSLRRSPAHTGPADDFSR